MLIHLYVYIGGQCPPGKHQKTLKLLKKKQTHERLMKEWANLSKLASVLPTYIYRCVGLAALTAQAVQITI